MSKKASLSKMMRKNSGGLPGRFFHRKDFFREATKPPPKISMKEIKRDYEWTEEELNAALRRYNDIMICYRTNTNTDQYDGYKENDRDNDNIDNDDKDNDNGGNDNRDNYDGDNDNRDNDDGHNDNEDDYNEDDNSRDNHNGYNDNGNNDNGDNNQGDNDCNRLKDNGDISCYVCVGYASTRLQFCTRCHDGGKENSDELYYIDRFHIAQHRRCLCHGCFGQMLREYERETHTIILVEESEE